MSVLVGLLGAVIGIGLFVAGFLTCRTLYAPKPVSLSEDERKRIEQEREKLEQDQSAFKQLLNYNTDIAYQVGAKARK